MALASVSLVLALLCGIVSASWGPHGLVADVDNSKGDFADLKVQWTAGDCPFSDFTLYSQAPGADRIEETYTSDTSFRIVNKEFWTNYTLSLDTWYCLVEKPLVSYVYTGPGNPHKVLSVEIASSVVVANVTVQEAVMSKPVDRYNCTWCSPKSCQTQLFARNNHGPAGKFDLMLKGLSPGTTYDLTVAPEILFQGEVYRGPEHSTKFSTKTVDLPKPSHIEPHFPWDATKHQEVKLAWKLDESPYQFAFFNVDVTSADDPTFEMIRNTTETELLLVDMPVSVSMRALITAVFNVGGQLLHGEPGYITFNTPDLDPRAGNFTYESLDERTIFAEWGSSLHLLPNSITFNFTYTNTKTNVTTTLTVPEPSIRLEKLDASTTYDVAISVLSVVMGSDVLEGQFTTLDKDYAAPVDVEVTPQSESADQVSYNISWTSDANPKKASKFQIKSCEQTSGTCSLNHTKDTDIVLPFDYFANYNLTVTAVYRLRLNQTQIRQGQLINIQTPGTQLLEVTNVTLHTVTSEDAVLVWTAPANVPKELRRNYKIFDAAENLINQTETEMVQLVGLAPYSFYQLNIQANVMYNNTEYSSNSTSFGFYSDSSTPGAPDTVEIEQIPRTNVAKVFWGEPRIANGQLDYYEVLVSDAEGQVVSNLTNLSGTRSVTIPLLSAHGDANYTVNVRAVNVDLQNESLPGNWTEATFLFKGIDPPTAEVVRRSSNSLTFKVTPANTTTDKIGLFYILKNGNNSFSDPSDQIEVKNLPAYTDATVEVYACYLPTFCSEPFTVTRRTNVAGPSQVKDLKGDFTNKTVPSIKWTKPDVLNGPLDGYFVELRDLTNASVNVSEMLPANQTSYVYETDMEFEKYNFTVVGFNRDLDETDNYFLGEQSSTMVNTTGDHPPKPENVHELNKTSTSASFQWERPEYPDFNVTHYFIQVPSLKVEKMTNETMFTLDGLKPWTKTNVLTSGCETENVTSCGLPGSYDIVTSVDKPSEPLSITFSNVTETEALVSWAEPSTPNGPITGYKIAVTESDNQNLTWNPVEERAAVHKLTNLTADTKYTVHLLAYNIDDDTGEELASPASMADFSTESTGGFAWWIVVVAIVVIAAGAVVGVVFYRRKKMQGEDREQLVQA